MSSQDSNDKDQAQEKINKLATIMKEQEVTSNLCSVGVGVIRCTIQRNEGRSPMRHSFQWSEEKHCYEEDPLSRHLEPPLSGNLELGKISLKAIKMLNIAFLVIGSGTYI